MNICRLNDTYQFVWAIDTQTTVDLIKFLQERGIRIPWVEGQGLKFKGNFIDEEV